MRLVATSYIRRFNSIGLSVGIMNRTPIRSLVCKLEGFLDQTNYQAWILESDFQAQLPLQARRMDPQ
jgi:hypothetical protein